ncbi:tyrosine-type recombinase/integrase [Enterococcus alishanensis]|uniref:Site-specific integrase n=1 Tax=Enterococcus alishanensis TaxID=1303817 RepID=A0ABS6TA73_9ENTE|nr:site-specific integrase [Enterococcus alishanensis]MBV7389775.1 site-specific integrase [Enterococcus alishanensis]
MKLGENIYLRKDGRWEGRYQKGRNKNNKIKYGYIYGKTKQEVRQKLYPLKEKYTQLRMIYGEATMIFKDWVELWLANIKGKIKPATFDSYSYKLKRYAFQVLGNLALNELDHIKIQEFINQMMDKLSSGTVKVICQIIKSCLSQAIFEGLIQTNPFDKIKMPKNQRKVRALQQSEQKKLEAVAKSEKKKGLPIMLALYAGLRIGELSALKWSDINFIDNLMHVGNTLQRVASYQDDSKTQVIKHQSKTHSSIRIIPFGDKIKQLLLQHQQEATGEYVFSTGEKPSEPRLLTYHFHKIREKADLKNIHFHQLRHTFATRCLEKRADISSVSALLGHSSTQMTLDIYADNLLEQRCKVMEVLDSCI